uniref:GPN-loop GTPase 2 n=1 Tax=Anopheles stephensi TaxID=30069 RepID=A0A182YHI5_ANOST
MQNSLVKLRTQTPLYGQLVIGPPGAGKTSYCHKMQAFLEKIGRKAMVVNLDPANDNMEYTSAVDIMQLITVQDAMEQFGLGPNGALIYCVEFLETNFQWLLDQLKSLDSNYFIFDCPGQVELFTHNNALKNIFAKLEQLGLPSMGLPHVNVLSKADQLKDQDAKLPFNVEYYTEVLDLSYLLECMDTSRLGNKFKQLNAAIVSMVEDYSLVSFLLLDARREPSLLRLKNAIDKANGYVYGAGEEKNINTLLACAVGAETESDRMERDIDPYLS